MRCSIQARLEQISILPPHQQFNVLHKIQNVKGLHRASGAQPIQAGFRSNRLLKLTLVPVAAGGTLCYYGYRRQL